MKRVITGVLHLKLKLSTNDALYKHLWYSKATIRKYFTYSIFFIAFLIWNIGNYNSEKVKFLSRNHYFTLWRQNSKYKVLHLIEMYHVRVRLFLKVFSNDRIISEFLLVLKKQHCLYMNEESFPWRSSQCLILILCNSQWVYYPSWFPLIRGSRSNNAHLWKTVLCFTTLLKSLSMVSC